MKKRLFVLLAILSAAISTHAQVFTLDEFLQVVMKGNCDLAAEQLNVSVSEAEAVAAKAGQDPSVSFGYDNNSDWDIAMGRAWSVEIAKPISIGKVSARTRLAKKNVLVAQASLADYRSELKAQASTAFADAVLARELADIALRNYEDMQQLFASDSLRHSKGDISELDLMQTRLEMVQARQDYVAQIAQYRNALVELDRLAGQPLRRTVGVEGSFAATPKTFVLEELASLALSSRNDLAAARLGQEVAQAEHTLAKRERRPDVELSAAASYNTRVRNEEAPAPEFVGYSVGLSIPLPISNVNRGVVNAGNYRVRQAELVAQSLEAQVQAEVVQAFNDYESARVRVEAFASGLLDQSRQVLEGRRYAYRRGESSLLELLAAQHSYNEMHQSYVEALHGCTTAHIALMRAVGE